MRERYADSLNALKTSVERLEAPFSIERVVPTPSAIRSFPPASIRPLILEFGYPASFVCPWIGNDFCFHGSTELERAQTGYGMDNEGDPLPGWDPSKYVIADHGADPVSIDPSGAIFFSSHGMGSWRYAQIAVDIAEFMSVLASIFSYFADNKQNVFDANFEVERYHAIAMMDCLSARLASAYAQNFFLLICR